MPLRLKFASDGSKKEEEKAPNGTEDIREKEGRASDKEITRRFEGKKINVTLSPLWKSAGAAATSALSYRRAIL